MIFGIITESEPFLLERKNQNSRSLKFDTILI